MSVATRSRTREPLEPELRWGGGRLSLNQLAYLRAIAQGLTVEQAARRYLDIAHGAEIQSAHRLIVERVAAVARRRRDPRWRLLGLTLHDAAEPPLGPPLEVWAESQGLDGWSERELQEMYAERFGTPSPSARRRQARNERLRRARLALLQQLEQVAATPAAPTDLLAGWLAPELAERLRMVGCLTLADLQQRIRVGGRWWSGLRAYGPVKAGRLAAYVGTLIGPGEAPRWSPPAAPATVDRAALDGSQGALRSVGVSAIGAGDDRAALEAWVTARSGTPATARAYRREAERFLLWMVMERQRALSDATVEDCTAYLLFLQDPPLNWVSRRKTERFAQGWAPFRGPVGTAGRALAGTALHSLYGWLVQVGYMAVNPWAAVNRRVGDDPGAQLDVDPSRAFTPAAWDVLKARLEREPAGGSNARLRWLLDFVETTGLRSSELLAARRSHLIERRGSWFLRVRGKGRKNRLVPVPGQGMRATRVYFSARGLTFDTADPETPLLANLSGGTLSYSALYETFTRFVRRAIAGSSLVAEERRHAEVASAHWLRHTHATRAAERGVELDVLQDNLGQADPRTTARYYRAQIERRRRSMEKAFGDSS